MIVLDQELEKKRKEFGKRLVYSLLGIILFYNVVSIFLKINFPLHKLVVSQKILTLVFLAIAYVAYMISKAQYNFFMVYRTLVYSLMALVFYISLSICHLSSVIFVFYLPIVLLLYMVSSIKKTAIAGGLLVILCFFTPAISVFLNISHPTSSSKEYLEILHYLEYLILFFTLYLSLLILYYKMELTKIELLNNEVQPNNKIDYINDLVNPSEKKAIDLEFLHNKIIHYLNTEKPYQNPDFDLNMLSKLLKTNNSYVSKAINKYGRKRFKDLVNEYRINDIKNEIDNKAYEKYTLKSIYEKSGFTQQSTFNRIFKDATGKNPSDYIESIK